MHPIFNLFLYLCAFYLVIVLLFYFFQDYFFFRPEILAQNFKYQYDFPFEEDNFEMEDGGFINGLHFKVPNSKGVVYYFKGNSRSVKGWGKFARDFVSKGYDFFMVDYRGFGKSRGQRTESTLFSDAQHIYKWLKFQYGHEDKIVIYGRSMGSGIATRIASWNHPKMLILDSPYYSFDYQVNRWGFLLPIRWLLKYPLRTNLFIKKVACPVFILHGRKDKLITFRQSLMLQNLDPNNIHLFPIDDGKHNNLPALPDYHDYLYDILNEENLLPPSTVYK